VTATPPGTGGPGTGGIGVARIAGAATLIAVLTVVARIAGVGRTYVFSQTVGATDLGGIYLGANTLPNIIFELVAGGAMASLVVPLLAGAVQAGDTRTVARTASALLTWVLALLAPAAVLVAVFARPIVELLPVDHIPDDQVDLAAGMLRVFAPQLPLYGIGIVLTGVLQAHRRFAWPVIAPLLSSVVVMSAYVTYAVLDGRATDVRGLSTAGELVLSIGTTAGVVVLSGCLLIPVRRLGLRLRPTFRFPGAAGRQAVRLGWAGAVTVGSQQLALLAVLALTWQVDRGQYAAFTYAQTVFLLPWAVLAVPIATAAYPALTAAHVLADEPRFADTLARAARGVVLFSSLGAAALVALAGPMAAVLATRPDVPVEGLALGLVGFAPGLIGYGLFALLSRALYARGATVSAAGATAAGWAVAAVTAFGLSAALADDRRVVALCLANALGMTVIGVLLVVAVRRHAGTAALAGLGRATTVGIIAGTAAALAGWATVTGLGVALGETPAGAASLIQGMLGGVVVAVVFAAVAYPLDRHDVRPLAATLAGKVGRRMGRGRRTAPVPPTPDGEEKS
jgi:putative peptidoglycan lipid II flippase